ncbi:MAG: flavodoxin family protein [Chloroflexi bacterium]|nr:flavodoxin family protein [Chloroflexota bacterium]
MKVIGIVGSPRKNGNTELLTAHALKSLAEEGVDIELVRLAGLEIRPCNACMVCKKEERCSIKDDLFPIYLKMKEADGIILASPVYYGSATALMKGLMERTGYISRWNGEVFRGKAGGPLVVARRAGKNFTFAQLTLWFQILGFFVPGSSYWNVAIGREKGEVESDDEGLNTAWNFGKNMAFLIKKLKG